jgi:CO/xanthine dehydrogenase FAD-binding subunit
VKPPPFEYHHPHNVEEALQLKERFGSDAVVLAGGQSLMPMLNMRLARPTAVIDIGGIRELAYVREDDRGLGIGAMTRQRTVERSPIVRDRYPLLAEAVANVAHAVIRNRGTVGGSIAHADPAAELPATLVALGGHVIARSVAGTRVIGAEDFFQFHLTTALEPNELVTEVVFPTQTAGSRWYFDEITRRHGDFALAGITAAQTANGTRLAFFGVGATPILVADPAAAADAVDPTDDVHGSAAYRRHLVSVLAERARKVLDGRD